MVCCCRWSLEPGPQRSPGCCRIRPVGWGWQARRASGWSPCSTRTRASLGRSSDDGFERLARTLQLALAQVDARSGGLLRRAALARATRPGGLGPGRRHAGVGPLRCARPGGPSRVAEAGGGVGPDRRRLSPLRLPDLGRRGPADLAEPGAGWSGPSGRARHRSRFRLGGRGHGRRNLLRSCGTADPPGRAGCRPTLSHRRGRRPAGAPGREPDGACGAGQDAEVRRGGARRRAA